MDCVEERVDLRIPHPADAEKGKRQAQLIFKLNHIMPMTEEYTRLCGGCGKPRESDKDVGRLKI